MVLTKNYLGDIIGLAVGGGGGGLMAGSEIRVQLDPKNYFFTK